MRARDGVLGHRLTSWIDTMERQWPAAFSALAFAFSFEIAEIFNDVRGAVRGVMLVLHAIGYTGLGEGAALLVTGAGILLLGMLAVAVFLAVHGGGAMRGKSEAGKAATSHTSATNRRA